jgi:hypothetical protein
MGRNDRSRRLRWYGVASTALIAFLGAVPAALATEPYISDGGEVGGALNSEAVSSGGGLPFTGLNIGLMVLGAGLLLSVGLLMRRLGRSPS